MKLSELAFTSFCYGLITKNDEAYIQLLQTTNGVIELNNLGHRHALLKWLNHWGCRQFAREYHDLAQRELLVWYNQYSNILFPYEKNIWELNDEDNLVIRQLFESLFNRTASIQRRGNHEIIKRFGAIGAAKILFAIRPKCFLPWDNSILDAFDYDKSPDSYIHYIEEVKSNLQTIKIICEQNEFTLKDLPQKLGRPNSSIPKLIDEYFWMTITQNWRVPDNETLIMWALWNNGD